MWVVNAEHRLLLDAVVRRDTIDAERFLEGHIRRTRIELGHHPGVFGEQTVTSLTVNGRRVEVDRPDDTPLLTVLRDALGLVGSRFGCGQGLCGACVVLLDGNARAVVRHPAVAGRRRDRRHRRGTRRPTGRTPCSRA